MTATTQDGSRDKIVLRDVHLGDLPIFFEQQLDLEAIQMAAFTRKDPSDREAFMAHWGRIMADVNINIQTIARSKL